VLNLLQKLESMQGQTERRSKVGSREAFLTYLLCQSELTHSEVVSNCIDLMLAAVETVFYRLLF